MPEMVHNNVEGHRLLDNGRVVEDVTSITLPNITHPTTEVKAAGMAGTVNMPQDYQVDPMELSIAHNNGKNSERLRDPAKHTIEIRLVRQVYDVAAGAIKHQSVKYRCQCFYVGEEKGAVETGNPLGKSDRYSVSRYEEIVEGNVTTLVDIMTGDIMINGVNYGKNVENMLK